MRTSLRLFVSSTLAVGALVLPLSAGAAIPEEVSTFTWSDNMTPLGASPRAVPLTGPGSGVFNSDLAFWGKTAIQGTYEGFRLIDVSDPANPVQLVNFTGCVQGTTIGNQGDVVVWDDILVRSWNSPAPAGGAVCGGITTPAGQEGLHVFDISNPANPVGLAFVPTPCGSHTATGVPDLASGRLLIYSSSSSGAPPCRGIDIVEVPLDDPAAASYLRFEPSGDPGPHLVTVDPPSSAAGTYLAADAAFGPKPTVTGVSGAFALANDGVGTTSDGCEPFSVPAGAIAIVDRGQCNFTVKVKNAQNGGASAVVVVNNVPTPPDTMGGADPTIVIPAVQVSQSDGATIKAGLPATGRVHSPADHPARPCHDTGVILGQAMKVACAGHDGVTGWTIDPAKGGSLEDPEQVYSHNIPGVEIGHTAAFTWDGEVLVFGHEPGGGSQARCQATSAEVDRTLFFLDGDTGEIIGTILHPRPQTATENCTWHNLNVIPNAGRYVLVSGNYQSGISVVEFTNPANASEIAFADPAPLDPNVLRGGGDWSTYWYDGLIYESDMTRGLIIWRLSHRVVIGARTLGHLNPQTQETSFRLRRFP